MSDISVRAGKSFLNEDQRWIGSGGISAMADADTITLDRSGVDLVTNFPNNLIPSGVCLGQISSSKLWVPYPGQDSETQTVTVDATGGVWTLAVQGEVTANIATNATGAAVQAALEALSNVNPGDIVVVRTGSVNAYVYTLTFGGQYAVGDQPAVVSGAGGLTGGAGTAVVATVNAGGTVSDGSQIAQGFLLTTVALDPNSTGDIVAALYWHGQIVESMLPAHHGLDAGAKSQLASKFRFV